MTSRRVLPWIGGPSSSSSPGRMRKFTTLKSTMIVTVTKTGTETPDQDVVEVVDRPGLRRGRLREPVDRQARRRCRPPMRSGRGRPSSRLVCSRCDRVPLLMRLGILCGARDERQSGAVAPGAAPLGARAEVRNGCRKGRPRRRPPQRAPGGARPHPTLADQRRGAGMQAVSRRRGACPRGSGGCRGTPTARGRGGAGTPWRTGRAGGSRRGGRPRGRSARASASSSAARSMRTAVRCSRNVVLPISAYERCSWRREDATRRAMSSSDRSEPYSASTMATASRKRLVRWRIVAGR